MILKIASAVSARVRLAVGRMPAGDLVSSCS